MGRKKKKDTMPWCNEPEKKKVKTNEKPQPATALIVPALPGAVHMMPLPPGFPQVPFGHPIPGKSAGPAPTSASPGATSRLIHVDEGISLTPSLPSPYPPTIACAAPVQIQAPGNHPPPGPAPLMANLQQPPVAMSSAPTGPPPGGPFPPYQHGMPLGMPSRPGIMNNYQGQPLMGTSLQGPGGPQLHGPPPRGPPRRLGSHPDKMAEAMSEAGKVKVGALQSLDDDGMRCLDDVKEALDIDCPGWKFNKHRTWMIPPVFEMDKRRERTGQLADNKFFDVLHGFGERNQEPMFVMHAIKCEEKIPKFMNRTQDQKENNIRGEHDFVVIHRNKGLIFFKVKAEITPSDNFPEAGYQLTKDKNALAYLIVNHFKGELRNKMRKEFSNAKKYVVMPNLWHRRSPHLAGGIFREDCYTVEAFSTWWRKNILCGTDPDPDQEVYECLVMCFVGLNRCVSKTLSSSIEESNQMQMDAISKTLKVFLGFKAVQWINGPAGSGKGWILKEKVKDLSRSRSGDQILVVCFNKPFSKSLEKEFKDCRNVVVKVFNELLSEITKKRCCDQEMEEHINLAVAILEGKTPEYDHIFVDQCEDLIGEKWPVLFQKMWKGNDDDCGTTEVPGCKCKWYFYDTNQCGRWSDEDRRKVFRRSLELTQVVRTTGNIFDQCKKYLHTGENILGPEDCGLNIQWQASLPSREVTVSEGARLVAKCIDKLRKENVSEADVCVLVQNEEIRDQLSSELKGLDVDNHNAEEQFEGNHKNKVVVESIRRFKRLKSKVVILYNPEFALKHNSHIRQLLYTAFSRCTCYLEVITTDIGVASFKSKKGVGMMD